MAHVGSNGFRVRGSKAVPTSLRSIRRSSASSCSYRQVPASARLSGSLPSRPRAPRKGAASTGSMLRYAETLGLVERLRVGPWGKAEHQITKAPTPPASGTASLRGSDSGDGRMPSRSLGNARLHPSRRWWKRGTTLSAPWSCAHASRYTRPCMAKGTGHSASLVCTSQWRAPLRLFCVSDHSGCSRLSGGLKWARSAVTRSALVP